MGEIVDTSKGIHHGIEEGRDLLRFITCGSVDDGKSTLIGRLQYDTKTIFEDQLEHVEDVSRRRGNERTDLALLTDPPIDPDRAPMCASPCQPRLTEVAVES